MNSRFCLHMWRTFKRIRQFSYIPVEARKPHTVNPLNYTIGLSFFTLLGLEVKESAEDDLIKSIKHSILFIRKNEYDRAEKLLHISLRQAQQMQNEMAITYIYDVMANLALERNQLDKAKKLFVSVSQRLMQNGATEDDPRIIHISMKLARISHLNQEYEVAQIGYEWCLQKLVRIMENNPSNDNIELTALAEDWYGRLFLECNKVEHAVKYMVSALNKMKESSTVDISDIIQQMNDIGTLYDRLGKTEESIAYLNDAIFNAEKVGNYDHLGILYVNLGRTYLKQNLISEARKRCGYGWRLGKQNNNDEIVKEAEACINEVNNAKL